MEALKPRRGNYIYVKRVLWNPPTTDPPITDPTTTDQPAHWPNNHRSTDKIMFKRLDNMKTFILQNANTAILRFIIYLNRIEVFDRMNNICLYNFERSKTDELIMFIFTLYSSTIFCKARCFSFLLTAVLIKFDEAIQHQLQG